LWEFTPPTYSSFAGSYRITTATPVADPDRQSIYAAAPDGVIRKLSIADGHVEWATPITNLPTREKIASPLNFDRGHVIAATGGYIGDAPPYQGHVAILDGATGTLLHVWNALCSDRAGIIDPSSCSASDAAIWGRAGAVIDTTTGDIFVATGNAPWNGTTNWGDAIVGTMTPWHQPGGAGGLLYVYDPNGHVRVYDAIDGNELASLDCGDGHWNSPILVDGIIVLPEGNANGHATRGVVNIFRAP
jgi:hypothetical protein